MSKSVKRNNKGRYYTAGKRYSAETYASIFRVAIEYRKVVGVFPLPAHLSEMTSISFKVAKKALLYVSGENDALHKPSGHGYSGYGSMTLSMTDQFFLLGLYHKDPGRPLYSYVTELHEFSGTKVSTTTLSDWFHNSLKFKATCRKPSIFPDQKFSTENIKKLNYYINLVSYFDHSRFVFTDEKPMKGIDIYNKKVRRSPFNGSIPFVATGFDIRNVYNLMAAIKINDENSHNSETNISYQIGKYQGTSTAFNFFITKLVTTGFLKSGHILICDNASIHLTAENRSLSEILWEEHGILLLYLPPYSPELNPIELVFQLLGVRLRHSNARYESRVNINEDFFMLKCVEVLESITNEDVRKNYKKCGYNI